MTRNCNGIETHAQIKICTNCRCFSKVIAKLFKVVTYESCKIKIFCLHRDAEELSNVASLLVQTNFVTTSHHNFYILSSNLNITKHCLIKTQTKLFL